MQIAKRIRRLLVEIIAVSEIHIHHVLTINVLFADTDIKNL